MWLVDGYLVESAFECYGFHVGDLAFAHFGGEAVEIDTPGVVPCTVFGSH